jgi:phytoene dehydrogenase-like protein
MLSGRLLGLSGTLALVRLFARLGRIDASSLGTTSVQQWLDAEVHHPRLRLLMDAFARTFVYSAALDLVSADVFVDKLQRSLKHHIHYVEGGWQTLVDGLRRTAEAAGVRVVTGTRVEAVLQQGGKVTGVRTRDGEMMATSSVVVATTPQDVAALLDGDFPALRRTLAALVPARLACVDVALRALPRPDHPVVLDLERPLFMTAQSRYIPVAPRGAALVHTFKLLDPRHEAPAQDDERALEGLLDAAQPGWRDALVRQVSLPRILAVGALPLARSGGFAGRPGPAVPGLAGLYLAGDWVGAEGFLVDASFASARQAARLALAQRPSALKGTPRRRAAAPRALTPAAA